MIFHYAFFMYKATIVYLLTVFGAGSPKIKVSAAPVPPGAQKPPQASLLASGCCGHPSLYRAPFQSLLVFTRLSSLSSLFVSFPAFLWCQTHWQFMRLMGNLRPLKTFCWLPAAHPALSSGRMCPGALARAAQGQRAGGSRKQPVQSPQKTWGGLCNSDGFVSKSSNF